MTDSGATDEALQSRDRLFATFADKFIEELRRAQITGATQVSVIYHCVDQQGRTVDQPISITPRMSARFPGEPEAAKWFSSPAYLAFLIGNINSMVRYAPIDLLSFPEHPGVVVRIQGFELKIMQP
jgi:hypothetical protein